MQAMVPTARKGLRRLASALALLVAIALLTTTALAATEDAKLTAADAAAGDWFGRTVAVEGSTVIVGAILDDDGGTNSGSAYVYDCSSLPCTQVSKLTASDAVAIDELGGSLALSGSKVVIGVWRDDDNGSDSGSAYVFDLASCGAACTESDKLTASDAAADDRFGWSVALSGSTVVVGAMFDDDGGSDSGSAYVYDCSSLPCTQISKLTASDAAVSDFFGYSVALSGSTALVGAYLDDDGGPGSGSAYAFDLSSCGAACTESDKLTASDAASGDNFGVSVAIDGQAAVVGANGDDDGGGNSGAAYVYDCSSLPCTESAKLTASDAASADQLGISVAISGATVVAGARLDDDAGTSSGSAYVFDLSSCGATCIESDKLTASDAAAGDEFGFSVAISGGTAVVGAYLDDDGGTDSGSAYLFTGLGAPAGATLTAVPTPGDIYPGDTVTVDLNVANAADLYGLQTTCTVDPAVLATQSGAFGPFFTNPLVGANTADAGAGTWFGGVSQQSPGLPLSGGGLFATLSYQALVPGSSSVACTPLASDIDGFTLPITPVDAAVTVLAFGSIDGSVTYQGRLAHASITVDAIGPVSNSDNTDAAGAFDIDSLEAGSYDVKVDAPRYLPACNSGVVVTNGAATTLAAAQLRGGDVNDDDAIDIGDATLVTANFGLDVPPGAAAADINDDATVNIQDLSILGGNFGLTGCQNW